MEVSNPLVHQTKRIRLKSSDADFIAKTVPQSDPLRDGGRLKNKIEGRTSGTSGLLAYFSRDDRAFLLSFFHAAISRINRSSDSQRETSKSPELWPTFRPIKRYTVYVTLLSETRRTPIKRSLIVAEFTPGFRNYRGTWRSRNANDFAEQRHPPTVPVRAITRRTRT